MELILLMDVEKVGRKGEVVRVRDGFGRNFLLPRKLALASTKANQAFVQDQKTRALARRENEKLEAQATAARLSKIKIVLEARAGEQDKLFGSVTSDQIREALEHQGYRVDKKHIHLKEAIHSLGSYEVTVELYSEVKAIVALEVIRKS
ncbi:MAG: 50S ribosomal protein L9 [Candidatus Omnitrophica bacterium]|nr:50S ribosomal protein L9 [Candidatus Omnitrophota bacterium]